MSSTEQSTLPIRDKIDILFKEYDTLRAQVVSLISTGAQIATVAVAAISWLSTRPHDRGFWSLTLIISGATCLFVLMLWREMYFCSRRVAEIEREINGLAGATLLKWESQYSPGSFGAFGWLLKWRSKSPRS